MGAKTVVTGVVIEVKKDCTFQKAQGGGEYKGTRFTYVDNKDGEIRSQKFHENVMKYSPDVASGLNTLVKDDEFTMVKEKKDGSDFWNATSLSKGLDTGVDNSFAEPVGNKANSRSASTYVKPTYETPEERAHKQFMITRSVALGQAVILAGGKGTVKAILKNATEFEDWMNRDAASDADVNGEVEVSEVT